MARDQHTTKNIHNLDTELEKALSALLHHKEYRLDVIFEKYPRHGALADLVGLFRHGVLVREERGGTAEGGDGGRGARDRVDGGHYRKEVLEAVEVVGGPRDGAVEGVDEGGVEGAEGELGDYVGEVECWGAFYVSGQSYNSNRMDVSQHTCMIQMTRWATKLLISVSSRRDMKVTHDFVHAQAAKYATTVRDAS
jgi:hypothetical protein